MTVTSLLTTLFTPDSPVKLVADWFMNKADRQYIDSQSLQLQALLTYSLRGQTGTWVKLHSSSPDLAAGDCVCVAPQVATEDNPLTAVRWVTKALASPIASGGVVLGIAATAATANGWVRIITGGIVGPSLTGLPAAASGPVRLNTTTGRCVQGALSSGTYPIGFVDPVGNLSLVRSLIVP